MDHFSNQTLLWCLCWFLGLTSHCSIMVVTWFSTWLLDFPRFFGFRESKKSAYVMFGGILSVTWSKSCRIVVPSWYGHSVQLFSKNDNGIFAPFITGAISGFFEALKGLNPFTRHWGGILKVHLFQKCSIHLRKSYLQKYIEVTTNKSIIC